MKSLALAVVTVLVVVDAASAQTPDAVVRRIRSGDGYRVASGFLDRDYDRFVRELITLTEIPAPPFKERVRAAAYLELLKDAGLAAVEQDDEGNVMGVWRGSAPAGGPMLAVLAHLDTVFPEGTAVKVKKTGTRLEAPGIGDDTRGLAVMLSVVRAMRAAGLTTRDDILFVGNVGEEGEGDLRGVKYLLSKGRYKARIRQFVSIDGAGEQRAVVTGAVGSLRYRVAFKGPGGHSYGAFGVVNPAFAMGDAIQRFSKIAVPAHPKTTFNVGVVGGGASVNAIPADVFMDVDMRSESPAELKRLDTAFRQLVADAVAAENSARSSAQGRITADLKLIGDRPSGATAVDSMLVQTTAAVIRAFGATPSFTASSTDANFPISLGIPAITIATGGDGGRAHALDEWTDVDKSAAVKGAEVVLTLLLAVAGAP